MDLQRTPPELFVDGPILGENAFHGEDEEAGRDAAKRLLLAYATHRPDIGYCQGLNFVAAVLLTVLDEYSAFIVLCGLLDRLPRDMYSLEPERLANCRAATQEKVHRILTLLRPRLAEHFATLELDLNLFLPRWLSTLFSGVLVAPATIRLWDHVLGAGGQDAVVRLALAMLMQAESRLLLCGDIGEFLEELASTAKDVATSCDVDTLLDELPARQFKRLEKAAENGSFSEAQQVLHAGRKKWKLYLLPAVRKRSHWSRWRRKSPLLVWTALVLPILVCFARWTFHLDHLKSQAPSVAPAPQIRCVAPALPWEPSPPEEEQHWQPLRLWYPSELPPRYPPRVPARRPDEPRDPSSGSDPPGPAGGRSSPGRPDGGSGPRPPPPPAPPSPHGFVLDHRELESRTEEELRGIVRLEGLDIDIGPGVSKPELVADIRKAWYTGARAAPAPSPPSPRPPLPPSFRGGAPNR